MRTVRIGLALFVFWCIVVPPEGGVDLLVGVGVSIAVSAWAARFLWPPADPYLSSLQPWRLPGFLARTVWRVVTSSAQVLRIVVDPRLPVSPVIVRHTASFRTDAARAAFANAITVTPGTLTLDVEGDTFVVHCLDRALATDLLSGRLAADIELLFERRGAT